MTPTVLVGLWQERGARSNGEERRDKEKKENNNKKEKKNCVEEIKEKNGVEDIKASSYGLFVLLLRNYVKNIYLVLGYQKYS